MERCSAIGIICRPESSSMRGNDGTTHRKAQSHPLCFCGEERLEDLFQFFLRNGVAPIANGYKHGAAVVLNSSTNEQSALRSSAISYRVTSIDHQVN